MKWFLVTSVCFNFLLAGFSYLLFDCMQNDHKWYKIHVNDLEQNLKYLDKSIDNLIEQNRKLGGQFSYY